MLDMAEHMNIFCQKKSLLVPINTINRKEIVRSHK